MRKDAEEFAARWAAKKEREKQKAKRKKGGGKKAATVSIDEDNGANWELILLVAVGIFTALSEALDMDVLLGILFMPFTKTMQYFAEKFDNIRLDPSYWMTMIGHAYNDMCKNNPGDFVRTDLSFFVVFAVLILFEADISKWWRERNLGAQGYGELEEEEEEDDDGKDEGFIKLFHELDLDSSGWVDRSEMEDAITKMFGKLEPKVVGEMMAASDTDGDGKVDLDEFLVIMRAGPKKGPLASVLGDADAMQVMLRNAREGLEEVDIKLRLRGNDENEQQIKEDLKARRKKYEDQVGTLTQFLSAMETEKAEEVDLEAAAREAEAAEAAAAKMGGCAETTKTAVTILKNTISGVLTIYLYFMDLISDYQVTMLYYNVGAMRFAAVSAGLLIGQFAVVWLRVLPYLYTTYGSSSLFYRCFLIFGLPFGCFFFDALMFLGPFGLLPIVPMPESMRLFIPAYAATRMIAEVLVEALPQWIMQAVIFVLVSQHVRDGTASDVDMNLYTVQNGSFVSLMPKSILISSLTMLKTWYDLVQEAREAGISVAKKGLQLWNVGAGLPLDAIKSGSISGWRCSYEISDQEVVSLVDALGKNDSLERLDLSLAGFEWMPPVQREERNAMSTLLQVMNADSAALESLETLVISQKTQYEIPILALRSGPEKALKTLSEIPFLTEGGPGREEMQTMFELLCKNRGAEPGEAELEVSLNAATKIFTDSQKGSNKKTKRASWQTAVAQLISKGMTRRSHFSVVVGAEVLHNVGFTAQELLDIKFSAEELKAGFVEAWELKEIGFTPARLKKLGYSAKEMWEAEIPACEMKKVGFTARQLRDGGYTAQHMRNDKSYSLIELKEGRYKAVDLGNAGYLIPDLRAAKFTALDLRKALIFNVQMMRDAGYTAVEMKKAGYDAKRIRDAGYDATEATQAGYNLAELFGANYDATGVRKAGHTAPPMREIGYNLIDLKGAGFSGEELMEAGYTAQELKEAGTSLVQLKAANTPMATLKDIGYTAERLKQQGYTAAELSSQSKGRIDIKTREVTRDEGGYTAKELRGGGITATELRKGKVFFVIAEWKDAAWPTRELREGGYTAFELRVCGYAAKELHKNGFTVAELVEGEFPIRELRAIGATAGELREVGINAKTLAEVGYSAKELLIAGFSAEELIACGFGVAALREAGFDAIQLRRLGFSAAELKAYGYSAGQLKEAGCLVKELKELGFSAEELEEAGFSRRAVEAVDGRSVRDLKEFGAYEVSELREYGYVVADLRGIYTVKDMKDQGYSLDELLEGGIPDHAVLAVDGRSTRELRKAGYLAKILKKVGFELYELAEGDYTATELKEAFYDAEELKDVGFSAGALRVAGFTSKQLRAARYTLKDMQQGGYAWNDLVIFLRATYQELVKAGYTGLDPKHRLFLEYREREDEEIMPEVQVSSLSPTYHQRSFDASMSPREMPRIIESDVPLQVRQGVALTSKKAGTIGANTKLRVLETRAWREDGTQRVLVGAVEANEGSSHKSMLPFGWVTLFGGGGKPILAPSTPRTPRAASCSPGSLSHRGATNRGAESQRLSARLAELGSQDRRDEREKKQKAKDELIDELMDMRMEKRGSARDSRASSRGTSTSRDVAFMV